MVRVIGRKGSISVDREVDLETAVTIVKTLDTWVILSNSDLRTHIKAIVDSKEFKNA